ncbi:CRISPR-associated protein Csx3 [Thermogemmatispora carboxidivorans]|uniref:CRISPR-associated protein Csx3 n=1 Tax=Thermogemmatispora carboxidivorans TaxID=1382306 RepID=UPI00069BE17A|nr:CRISPR-associated protein Csx3 [Thermogemmatispora carboxidivorans]
MVSLPAVLIAGTPHSGKSVLAYYLCQALCERKIPHYLLRACPDGEGNWFYSADPERVSAIRQKHEGPWPESFRTRIRADLYHRRLPLLVDIGGKPCESDQVLLKECTHAILLRRADQPVEAQQWLDFINASQLELLADLSSTLKGESSLSSRGPVLEGTISGLERQKPVSPGPVLDELIARLSSLFKTPDLQRIEDEYRNNAPVRPIVDLDKELSRLRPEAKRWEPDLLSQLLGSLSPGTPLAVYGRAPNWLYAALAAFAYPAEFYLFDTKLPLAWVRPVEVKLADNGNHPDLCVQVEEYDDFCLLGISLPGKRLEYWQPQPLPLPSIPRGKGLVIDGPLPFWLLTAIIRCYLQYMCLFDLPWVAPVYVASGEGKKPIIVWSRVPDRSLGEAYPKLPENKPVIG